jgi:hypothetical protein
MSTDEIGTIQQQYVDKNGNALNIRRDYNGDYVPGENEIMPAGANNLFGSIYIGKDNPVYYDADGKKHADYRREPQDAADALALAHDKRYDLAKAAGALDAFLNREFPVRHPDQQLVDGANDIIQGAKAGAVDPVTDKPVSDRTINRAKGIKIFFGDIILKQPLLKGPRPGPIDPKVKAKYMDKPGAAH